MALVNPTELNNFFFNLPGGFYREISTELGILEKTFEEHILSDDSTQDPSCMSEKKMKQTIKEFFETIDLILKDQGHHIPSVENEVKKISGVINRGPLLSVFYYELLGVYEALIEEGYSHEDLTT